MITIQSLLQPMTAAQIRASMVNVLLSLSIPADQWRKGGVASTILTVVATQFAAFQNLIVQGISSGFLETASGGWLRLLAQQFFGIDTTLFDATFASGQLTLTNTGGGIYNFAPFTAKFQTAAGQVYTNVTAIALGALATQTITIQAMVQGSVGTAGPGAINTLITTMIGVTCTNASSVVGQDAITDAALRTLCTSKIGILSVRGPRTAYAYAVQSAINPSTGLVVQINRVSVNTPGSTGVVNIYCAAPSGIPSSGDLAAAAANVEAIARPDGVTANVLACTTAAYTPTITVWAQGPSGLTPAAVQAAATTAIANYISTYPIGGQVTGGGQGLFGTGIDGAIADGLASIDASLIYTTGAVDLALVTGEIATDSVSVIGRLATSP